MTQTMVQEQRTEVTTTGLDAAKVAYYTPVAEGTEGMEQWKKTREDYYEEIEKDDRFESVDFYTNTEGAENLTDRKEVFEHLKTECKTHGIEHVIISTSTELGV